MSKSDGLKGRFALFCDYAFTTSEGKLSIIGEFDQLLGLKGKPTINKAFLVGSFLGNPREEVHIEVEFVDNKGNNILPSQSFKPTTGERGITNIIIEIGGLVFDHSGIYKARFMSSGKPLAEAELRVEDTGNAKES